MTEYNKVETQDGYTKVRTHDFVAIENELAALRAERDELREALQTALHRADQALHFTAETIEPITAEWLDGIISNARAVLAKYEKE